MISGNIGPRGDGYLRLRRVAPEQHAYLELDRVERLGADQLVFLMLAGAIAEGEDGRDSTASEAMFTSGWLTMAFAAPAIHLARGQGGRFAGSLLLRAGLAGLGMTVAMQANADCDDGQPPPPGVFFNDDFLCELDYAGYGIVGGMLVASALDAVFMTDEKVEARWAPQVWANRGGGGVGAAWAW